jgi:hypothetical protein
MKADKEISEVLGDITPQQMDAAIAAINNYGFDISAPWDGDQDDREYEMFCGLLAAVRAAITSGVRESKS